MANKNSTKGSTKHYTETKEWETRTPLTYGGERSVPEELVVSASTR
jgi:hypothetical protein